MFGVELMQQPCPAECGRNQKPDKFLCLPCWSALPAAVRANVNRTWRAFCAIDRDKDSVGYLSALRAYRMARADAIRYLKANPAPAIVAPQRKAAEDLFS